MSKSIYATCSGCQEPFLNHTGYWSHLQLTSNEPCKAVLNGLLLVDVDSDSEGEDEDEDEMDGFQSPISLMGDAFGSPLFYANDNFGQEPEEEVDAQADDKNDLDVEQQLFDLEQENAWEPEHLQDEIGVEMEAVTHVPVNDNESEDFDTTKGRLNAESCADSHPQIIRYSDKYPTMGASAIKQYTTSTDEKYTTTINGEKDCWAPFSSEIDWKVARWAKLRGLGSTAFSDLLAIDGVCCLPSLLFIGLTPKLSRCAKPWDYRIKTHKSLTGS